MANVQGETVTMMHFSKELSESTQWYTLENSWQIIHTHDIATTLYYIRRSTAS
jgi:hypothetical protein